MRNLCCLLLVGCNTMIGSSMPDSAPTAIDDGGNDDGAVAALPREPRGLQLAPDGLIANAAIDVNGTLIVVGSRKVTDPSLHDGAIVRDTAQVATAEFAGGIQNDQLYAVAANGTAVLAVGITRSWLGSLQGDQVLLVFTGATGPTTIGRLYVAADEALQPRAVAPLGTGWLIGGHHLMGARGFLAVTDAAGAPLRSTSFIVGPTATGLIIRRVLSDATRIYAVGYAVQGAMTAGFVAAFDAATLAPVWGARVTGATDLAVTDADLAGTTLRVVGNTGSDGIVIDFDATNGTVVANNTLAGARLMSVLRDGFTWWVTGRTASVFAGKLDGDLHAVQLADFTLTGLSAQTLVPRADGMSVIGSRAAGMVEIPLNGTPVGACDGIALGAPTTYAASTGTSTVTMTLVTTRALPLTFQAPTPTVSTPTVTSFDACH